MEFWENFKGYIGQFCNILTKIVYSNNIYIMGINCLLISISGSPKILSDFIPDNGLGILASCLVKEGNNVKILDFNRIEIFRKVIPPEIKRFLLKLGRKIFIDGKRPNIFEIFKLKRAEEIIRREKENYCEIIKDEVSQIIEKEKINFVGMKLWAGEGFDWSMELGKFIKKRYPEVKIFGGGPQVDIFGQEIFKRGEFFDGLCYGEGEETIVGLANFVQGKEKLEGIPNLIFKKDGRIFKTPRKYIENLDNIPFPIYHPEVYNGIEEKIKMFVLDESRGCPNNCYFCIHPVKSGKRRVKSPERIIKEMKHSIEEYGVRLFRYAGSNTPAYLMEGIAKLILENGLRIKYTSFGHFKDMEGGDFALLKKSGCEALFFGVESANEEILEKGMNKKLKKKEMEEVIKKCKSAGIFTVVSLIYPAPFENEKTRQETLQFMRDTRPDSALVQFPGIYPGTVWFKKPEKFNFEIDKETYCEKVMNYKIKSLFPPRFWDPLPYKVNGMSFKEFAYETEKFQMDLKKVGINTGISDEAYLLYKYSGFNSLDEFLRNNRFFFFTGDGESLMEEIYRINENSKSI